jgi:hypothetical protein
VVVQVVVDRWYTISSASTNSHDLEYFVIACLAAFRTGNLHDVSFSNTRYSNLKS